MYSRLLTSWTQFVISRPKQVMGVISVVTLVLLFYAVTQFSMDSDLRNLVRQDTNWKRVYDKFERAFPQYPNNTFVVVSGKSLDAVTHVSQALEGRLKENTDTFQRVYGPANDEFIVSHALLFMEIDDLDVFVLNLADAQPVLTAIAEDPNLRGLFKLLVDVLSSGEKLPASIARLATLLSENIDQTLTGNPTPVSWRDEMIGGEKKENYYSIIFVQGRQDFGARLPNAQIISQIQRIIRNLAHPQKSQVIIRLTGQIPLEHGEIQSALGSAQTAGSIAAVFLMIVLVFGVGSLRIIIATYMTMLIGLTWTAAYAIFVVGHYNTISIIFLVMFIGLGVDFAIHVSLRYQEELGRRNKQEALIATSRDLGPAITLCGITSAIGFLAFVPTEFTGLAELGIISGGGMIIAVILSLTIIPAFFALTGKPVEMPKKRYVSFLAGKLHQYQHGIILVTFIIAGIALYIARDAYFDYSTLSLKDQQSEAMTTFNDLQKQGLMTDYSLSYVAPDKATALLKKSQLLELDSVLEVVTPWDHIPGNQSEKLYALEDAQFMLASVFIAGREAVVLRSDQREQIINELVTSLGSWLENENTPINPTRRAIERFHTSLTKLQDAPPEIQIVFENNVIAPLVKELEWLEEAIHVDAITFADLPDNLKSRLISENGKVLVMITPANNIVPVKAMEAFVSDVQSLAEEATGRAVTEIGVGEITVEAFQKALTISIISIFVILVITLRSLVDALLVFTPLAITTCITLATSVLVDLPLNMANVVVIPLIFGLGVDNGIHMVERFHESHNLNGLLESSTPRAVFLSTLTTLGTFGALSFSTHQGIYSVGVLLTCALSALMVLTLITLPALLSVFSTSRAASS